MGKSKEKEIDFIEIERESGKKISLSNCEIFFESEFPGCFEIKYKIKGELYDEAIPYSKLVRICYAED